MQNLLELENWMIENNIKNIFLPNNKNNRFVTDIGEGLEDVYGLFIWYTNDEKGNRTDLKFFKSEKEAVQYVYEYLLKNEK
jgi:hypothetical protein